MSLGDQQRVYTHKLGQLIMFAYSIGFELTMEEGFVSDQRGHIPGSYHYKKLAQDLNLFKDGKFLTETEDHLQLGEYWESIGGTWGGRFSSPDGNHYSWGE